ncbi:RagB/SusD family nutrient uptake outer membrane protein [Reichenbachiella ulvae]|uniref:RagB/SusD family nutrient uptake outer membrane protein n=1 Tax=Reichenbachiella ulvae TaxID=2980104 RepID=A0ABT3D0I3_9BACT|nr:RagB/SusD family nutrient uptake outer membrane protein [Reichenbachiella ulvae]MCV9389269.1 RagB/SusD family nutrient uptake outer membrane protein [Reichenbachiella ulvae]
MKNINKYIAMLGMLFLISSCEEYLEVPPASQITEEEVFTSYVTFQGFLDQDYRYLVDNNKAKITCGIQLAGETIAVQGWNTSQAASTGNYWNLINGRSPFNDYGNGDGKTGWWTAGWEAIRIANHAIEKIDLFQGSEEDRALLLGQAYFFRAIFHFEIMRAFGTIPYVDEILVDNFELPRHWTDEETGKKDCQAVAEAIVRDFEMAASLLPDVWENYAKDAGRATKGAALALKARTLLYAGSPLFNEFSGNSATFDTEYMTRAAEAAAEVLKLADRGVYDLVDFADYQDMFARKDGTRPITSESIFQKTDNSMGSGEVNVFLGRLFMPNNNLLGGNGITEAVTQNYVDLFEMADGTLYKDHFNTDASVASPYDNDVANRWDNRDPRFRKAIYVDGDNCGYTDQTLMNLYVGGNMNNANTLSPYIVHKYWPIGVNKVDGDWDQFTYNTPNIRLADVYLIYAEALFEATGNQDASSSNYGMTAAEAVDEVRTRAGMPTTANTTAYGGDFRKLVRNERHVELCFEGSYWYDLRRWKVKPDETLYRLDYDQAYSYATRTAIQPFIFTDRNWWLPFPRELTLTYEGFEQNPGWE